MIKLSWKVRGMFESRSMERSIRVRIHVSVTLIDPVQTAIVKPGRSKSGNTDFSQWLQ